MNPTTAQAEPGGVYFRSCLAPFECALARPDVTDIYVNRPGEFWIESLGGALERSEDPAINEAALARLARQIAALSYQGISREYPLLAATLPEGSRIQIVAPPATRGPLALAIRKQVATSLTLQDYEESDQFLNTRNDKFVSAEQRKLRELIGRRKFAEALSVAVRARKNIVVSGGTSSGKTTFLGALLREVPLNERLILIEDTPELVVEHENFVGLVSVRGDLGEAKVTTDHLVSACLRLRPDRIILGELRGPEAFAFLRAINTGHPGSMTTVHADSPETTVEQIVMLILQGGTQLSRADVRYYVENSVDLYVQLSRAGGRRTVEAVVLGETLAGMGDQSVR